MKAFAAIVLVVGFIVIGYALITIGMQTLDASENASSLMSDENRQAVNWLYAYDKGNLSYEELAQKPLNAEQISLYCNNYNPEGPMVDVCRHAE
jgi:hypothetical protein